MNIEGAYDMQTIGLHWHDYGDAAAFSFFLQVNRVTSQLYQPAAPPLPAPQPFPRGRTSTRRDGPWPEIDSTD